MQIQRLLDCCKAPKPFTWYDEPIDAYVNKNSSLISLSDDIEDQDNDIEEQNMISVQMAAFVQNNGLSNQLCEKMVQSRFLYDNRQINDTQSTKEVIEDKNKNDFSTLDLPSQIISTDSTPKKDLEKPDISRILPGNIDYAHPNYSIAAKNGLANRYGNALPENDFIYSPIAFEEKLLQPYYLNASRIELPAEGNKLVYIAAQAPLHWTFNEFWKAVVVGKSNIVTLAMPIENFEEKCEDYWSMAYWKEQKEFEIKDGEYVIGTLKKGDEVILDTISGIINQKKPKRSCLHDSSISSKEGECIVKRTFEFTSKDTLNTQTITQFHYKRWPDHGAPDPKLFNTLLRILDETPERGPLMVHCSAGIGRTGTLIAAHALRRQIQAQIELGKTPTVDIVGLIEQMRKQRARMVENKEQLYTLYSNVKDYLGGL